MMGYFEVQDLEYGGKKRLAAGMSDDYKVRLGRVRDYDLSFASSGLSMVSAFGATMATLMLL